MRRQLPVYSPLSLGTIAAGARAAIGRPNPGIEVLSEKLARRHEAGEVVLLDSGTSALVMAFRKLGVTGARIACPAYICVDVGAAAKRAGVQLVLYDSDPRTMSPDLSSLGRVLESGVHAVLVAHLYGFPVAISEMLALCRMHGVPLIEDAAQESGSRFRGRRAGSFGDLVVLSFGRGKGVTGGGGALMVPPASAIRLSGTVPPSGGRGWGKVAGTGAQWFLGRPSLYFAPLAMPGLKLGEMIYREADEPRAISRASTSMVQASLLLEGEDIASRRVNAVTLRGMATEAPQLEAMQVVDGAEPSYLRYPVLDGGRRSASPRAGITRGYPRLLNEEGELRGVVITPNDERLTGAAELRDRLFTLPTHGLLTPSDIQAIQDWFREPRS